LRCIWKASETKDFLLPLMLLPNKLKQPHNETATDYR
jgi:hypothetical protein